MFKFDLSTNSGQKSPQFRNPTLPFLTCSQKKGSLVLQEKKGILAKFFFALAEGFCAFVSGYNDSRRIPTPRVSFLTSHLNLKRFPSYVVYGNGRGGDALIHGRLVGASLSMLRRTLLCCCCMFKEEDGERKKKLKGVLRINASCDIKTRWLKAC